MAPRLSLTGRSSTTVVPPANRQRSSNRGNMAKRAWSGLLRVLMLAVSRVRCTRQRPRWPRLGSGLVGVWPSTMRGWLRIEREARSPIEGSTGRAPRRVVHHCGWSIDPAGYRSMIHPHCGQRPIVGTGPDEGGGGVGLVVAPVGACPHLVGHGCRAVSRAGGRQWGVERGRGARNERSPAVSP